jgi:hypothetical protein
MKPTHVRPGAEHQVRAFPAYRGRILFGTDVGYISRYNRRVNMS